MNTTFIILDGSFDKKVEWGVESANTNTMGMGADVNPTH